MSDRRRNAAMAAVLFLCVAVIGVAAMHGWLAETDRAILLALALPAARHPAVAELVTRLGDPGLRLVVLGAVLFLMLLGRRFAVALWLAVGVESGVLAERILKLVAARPRPTLLPHLVAVHDASFPSGHATNALLLYGAIAGAIEDVRWRRGLTIAALALALMVGLSRVALGVHWPSDVVAGWALGGGWLALALTMRPGRAAARI